jgi:transposase
MARKASGVEQLETARALLKKARTADELRAAQAIVLPLALGLSLEQTAVAIGRSVGATCTMRTRFGRALGGEKSAARSKRELRNRAKASLEQEAQILEAVLSDAATGGVVIVPPLKPAIEAKLGKPLALSTLYQMLSRHGWRKLAPDKSHPQADPAAREAWKKNSPSGWQRK